MTCLVGGVVCRGGGGRAGRAVVDLHLAVQVLVKVGGVRQLEVLHLPALVARRPDRVDSQDVGAGGGGAGC